ncbi:MAG: PAS domain-containing protein [Caulobacteraceae bacterium]
MFHSSTEFLIDYWRGRKGGSRLPPRSALVPGDFAHLLPQIFIGLYDAGGSVRLALAGEFLADLHGPHLRGADLALLWEEADRREIAVALAAALRKASPAVVTAEAQAEGAPTLDLEILFAPIGAGGSKGGGFLGLYQPLAPARPVRRGPERSLSILSIAQTGEVLPFAALARGVPKLRLAAVDGRRVL